MSRPFSLFRILPALLTLFWPGPATPAQESTLPLAGALAEQRRALAEGVGRMRDAAAAVERAGNALGEAADLPLVRLVDPVLKALHDSASGASSGLQSDSRDLRLRVVELTGLLTKARQRWEAAGATDRRLRERLEQHLSRWDKLAGRLEEGPSRKRLEAKEEFLGLAAQLNGALGGLEEYPQAAARLRLRRGKVWSDLGRQIERLAAAAPGLAGEAPARLKNLEEGFAALTVDSIRREKALQAAEEGLVGEILAARAAVDLARKSVQKFRP